MHLSGLFDPIHKESLYVQKKSETTKNLEYLYSTRVCKIKILDTFGHACIILVPHFFFLLSSVVTFVCSIYTAKTFVRSQTFMNEQTCIHQAYLHPLGLLSSIRTTYQLGPTCCHPEHAEGCKIARSNPGCDCAAPIYTMQEALRGYCP